MLKSVQIIVILLLAFASNTHSQEKVEYLTYVEPGQALPVSQFTDIHGQTVDWQQSNKNKLLILFATWCHDSQRAMKELVASDWVQQENLSIVAIGREESAAKLQEFAEEYQIEFALVADENRDLYSLFANAGIPRLILANGNNQIVKTIIAEGEHPLAELAW